VAEPETIARADSAPPGSFERDTAVRVIERAPARTLLEADVSPAWRAGRGPHGGYLAAMLLRALAQSVEEASRAARSLTIHFARAPQPGPVSIATATEREGRSLSTLSARMEQDGALIALALSAFSRPWSGPELAEAQMPDVAPPDPERRPGGLVEHGAPPFTQNIVLQPRIGGLPFTDSEQPMESGGWLGLAEPRPVDAAALAFYSDALIPSPFMRTRRVGPAPTLDLTVHFCTPTPREPSPDPLELCLVHTRASLLHEGFFVEDGTIWATDGTLLAQSRQLAILMHPAIG